MSVALIVGPGDRFLSGISYLHGAAHHGAGPTWTGRAAVVAPALSTRLLPRAGAGRKNRRHEVSLPDVPTFNGLDWFWGLSALRAWRFGRHVRPDVAILQWWTRDGVLHSYIVLAWLAKRAGARLVIEMHEVQDVGEASLPLASRYTRAGMRLVLSRADAIVVHSEFDRQAFRTLIPTRSSADWGDSLRTVRESRPGGHRPCFP